MSLLKVSYLSKHLKNYVHMNLGFQSRLVRGHGYPIEKHPIFTEDGYQLMMFRIPRPGAPAILYQHGLVGSSVDWVLKGPKEALAYLTWETGFDVWLGNNRGNFYSTMHKSLNTSSKEYWDFSFHELGVYDLPAKIDHIFNQTNQKQIFYVGYSQGCTQYMVMASEKPEYLKKICMTSFLAPSVFLKQMTSVFLPMVLFSLKNQDLIYKLNINQTFALGSPLQKFIHVLSKEDYSRNLVGKLYLSIGGMKSKEVDMNMLESLTKHIPAGSSIKQIFHFLQQINKTDYEFSQYDYGKEKNLVKYHSEFPPKYNISKSIVPVAVYYSTIDALVNYKDVEYLIPQLPNVIFKYRTNDLNHLDFLYGLHVKEILYDRILEILKKNLKNN